MAYFASGIGGGAAPEYEETIITTLNNGTIDTTRGGCFYIRYGKVIYMHFAVKDLTAETTTNVYTMPESLRPPHIIAFGTGIGADRTTNSSLSVGAATGTCNLWSESTTAVVDLIYIV